MRKYFNFFLLIFIFTTSKANINKKNLFFMDAKKNEALNHDFLNLLKNIFDINTFIETGTYLGKSCKVASEIFDEVITIELDQQLYQNAVILFKDNKNVSVYHGNSKNVFPNILNNLKNKNLFFLDAHWSEGFTAKGPENTPILAELFLIKKSNIKNAILLIDDIRLFQEEELIKKEFNNNQSQSIFGYPTIDHLREAILDININYEIIIFGDMLLAFLKTENIEVSPALKAMTKSRMASINLSNLEANNIIASATGIEKTALINLGNSFSNSKYVAEHYIHWRDLLS